MSNHREDQPIVHHDLSRYGDDDPTTEIVSFPRSVQDKLERAQTLLRQDRPAEARSALQEAGTELARTAPDLFVLMSASQMGARRIAFEESEANTRTVRTDRYVLGFRVGHEETTTTDLRTKGRSISLG